jgi:integrase
MPTLTEAQIRAAKPREKPYKLCDTRGLYLLIKPNDRRFWRFKYRFGGKEKLLSFGTYPYASLKRARDRREEARRLLEEGKDPSAQRQDQKTTHGVTFELVAKEWLALQRHRFAAATFVKAEWTFEDLINPYIGSRPVTEITAPELLSVFRRLEARGRHETAHRTRQRCSQVFRYAVATGRAVRDPTVDLRGALAPVVTRHHAAITEPAKVGELLRSIHGYYGTPVTGAALRLAPLLFVRPGELRKAEWSEFDFDAAEWRVPAHRMKMKEQHVVPLARQSVKVLRELHLLTGRGRLVFPSLRSAARPLSENAITAALRRMGYSGDEMTWHGFRTIASTCLNELGWNPDLIELQLAHAERDETRGAYNRAQRMAERRQMMQAWADYLDALRTNAAK